MTYLRFLEVRETEDDAAEDVPELVLVEEPVLLDARVGLLEEVVTWVLVESSDFREGLGLDGERVAGVVLEG